jgi:hypothetical protein
MHGALRVGVVRHARRELERTGRKVRDRLLDIRNAGVERPCCQSGAACEQKLIVILRQTVLDLHRDLKVRRGHARGRDGARRTEAGSRWPPRQRRRQRFLSLLVCGWTYLMETRLLRSSSKDGLVLEDRGIVGPRRAVGVNDTL